MAEQTTIDKSEGQRVCKLCQRIFDDIYSYADHLESKEHAKGIMKKKYAKKYLEAKARLDEKSIKYSSKPDEKITYSPESEPTDKKTLSETLDSESEDSDNDAVKPACAVCNMIFSGPEAAMDHFSSLKHKKTLKKMQKIEKHKNVKKSSKHSSTSDSKDKNNYEGSSDDSFENISSIN